MEVASSSRLNRSNSRSNIIIHVRGVSFNLDKELVAAKSAKISDLLKTNSQEDITYFLRDLPADHCTFELFARYCHGYDVTISTENVVQVSCLAHYLGMTEDHCPENLLNMAIQVFKKKVLPSWDKTIKALRASEFAYQLAMNMGLVEACSESLVDKALNDPNLLGDPIKNSNHDDECGGNNNENENVGRNADYKRPSVRKRLFVQDWKSEDLTNLSLRIYKPIVQEMIRRQVPSEYIASSLYSYAKKWAFTSGNDVQIMFNKPSAKNNIASAREVIEAIETLLPREKGILPCKFLFEMLRFCITLEGKSECRSGFESRIGKQLDRARVEDLLIPSQGYAKELQYDIGCVQRIVKHFYANYTPSNMDRLIKVAELLEGFLCEIAIDIDLKLETFIALADMSCAASSAALPNSDGMYRAIDLYFERHKYLTESEKEKVCNLLDCSKLSIEACDHAVKNRLLPLRVVVQVLFVSQLKIRGTITSRRSEDGSGGGEVMRLVNGDKEVMTEMEKMGSKVMELKRECSMMRKEIENSSNVVVKKEKFGVWKQMKRKFGCMSIQDCNCHEKRKKKKVHPSSKTSEKK